MSGKATETDKDVLKQAMANPTFKAIGEAVRAANIEREQAIREQLKAPQKPKDPMPWPPLAKPGSTR